MIIQVDTELFLSKLKKGKLTETDVLRVGDISPRHGIRSITEQKIELLPHVSSIRGAEADESAHTVNMPGPDMVGWKFRGRTVLVCTKPPVEVLEPEHI